MSAVLTGIIDGLGLQLITETHRVYAPDLPGYGDSDKPRGVRYNAAFYTAVLNDLRQSLDLEPFILVATISSEWWP